MDRFDPRDVRDRANQWFREFGIRIDAKRQALDALDAARRSTADNGDGNESRCERRRMKEHAWKAKRPRGTEQH